MCGIAGYFNNNSKVTQVSNIVDLMNNLQSHRGPNSSGKFINNEKDFCFKMCRLSILDLELGIQPMHSSDNRYVIIFNGTILNSPELRKKLEAEGIKFFTNNSDTEVLLNTIIKYGENGLKLLNGSFAFSLYDKKKRKLFCARDRFGLAPFYYLHKNNRFLFASELKSILLSGESTKEINKQNLYHYLSLLWSPGPETIIEDIYKLQPGHFLKLDLNSNILNISKWYEINFETNKHLDIKEWQNEIFTAIEKSVINSTLSDVPLSCGLSGGLDSQSIVGMLSKNKSVVNTFSLGFSGHNKGPLNELGESRYAAEYFGSKHQEILIEQNEYFSELDKMIYHLDEPYGGGLPLWHIFKETGKNFGVILTGLGGDELFGNFGRWTLLEKTFFNYFNNFLQFKLLFFDRKYFFTDELKNKLLFHEDTKLEKTSKFLFKKISNKNYKNIRDKICYLDLTTQLPDEYCNMTNKFSMANKIEARAPFLDNNITDLIQQVPSAIRTNRTDFKYLLRNTVKDILPSKNLHNRKRGFVGLESQKIKHDFDEIFNETFEKSKINKQGIFKEKFLYQFLNSFKHKGNFVEFTSFGYKKTYNEKSLWALIMFQKWYDIFIKN